MNDNLIYFRTLKFVTLEVNVLGQEFDLLIFCMVVLRSIDSYFKDGLNMRITEN